MTDAEHPLGPWQWDPDDRIILDREYRGVAGVCLRYEAAGRVIAAAPELLTALRDAVAAYGQPGGPWSVPTDPGGWLAKARAAIAKAEGPMIDWHPIDDNTPRDRPVLILAPAMDRLPDLVALTTWHPDAGFCVCPLRRATHWAEYRRPDDQAMRDHGDALLRAAAIEAGRGEDGR